MANVPPSVTAFDERIIDGKLKAFVDSTNSFAAPMVVEQVQLVDSAFKNLRTVILAAASCTKPDAKAFASLLEPLSKDVSGVLRVPEANRKERVWFNHLQIVAEGTPSVGWVETPKPGPHIAQMKDSSEFYTNKIIKEYKDKDPKHVEWSRAWIALLEEQRKYVIEFHTTGLAWNPKGVPFSQFSATSSVSGSAPPPPPPPPPAATAASPASAGGASAVFAELNRGEDVTKGLRKVDKSEMTHKNPNLRASSVVQAPGGGGTAKRPTKPSKPASLMGKKPSKFALEGGKWTIEYYENEPNLVVENAEIGHVVYIYGCKNTTIQVKGKVNAINLANCTKTSVLCESVISVVSVTNSPSFALQITGTAPTIQIDSTDSGQVYLSKECLRVEITTAKCSSINVSLPVEGEEDGVFVERAVPEMLRTTISKGKLVTTIVEHSG